MCIACRHIPFQLCACDPCIIDAIVWNRFGFFNISLLLACCILFTIQYSPFTIRRSPCAMYVVLRTNNGSVCLGYSLKRLSIFSCDMLRAKWIVWCELLFCVPNPFVYYAWDIFVSRANDSKFKVNQINLISNWEHFIFWLRQIASEIEFLNKFG